MRLLFKRGLWMVSALMFGACLPPKADAPASDTSGIFSGPIPSPKPKTSQALRTLLKKIGEKSLVTTAQTSLLSPKQHLQKTLVEAVSDLGGLPRWQIRHVLLHLIDPSSKACGGASCARIFDLYERDIDPLLDDTYRQIEAKSSYWNDATKKERLKVLLASFRRDYGHPLQGTPHTPVKFKNPAIALAVQAQLREGPKTVTLSDLSRITSLEIVLHTLDRPAASLDLEDLFKLPKLRELRIASDSLEAIPAVARYGDHLQKIVFSWTPTGKDIPRVRSFETLSSLPKLYDLKLVYTSLEDADQLARTLPRIRNFTIDRPMTKVTDITLRYVADMPSLRHVGLHGVPYEDLGSMTMTFPKKVVSAEYVSSLKPRDAHQPRVDRCGDLGHLRIFAQATTMTIQGCRVGAISGFGKPVAWQILSLKQCASETSAPLKLNPSPEVSQLMIFQRDGSPTLDIDELTRHEITARLAHYREP